MNYCEAMEILDNGGEFVVMCPDGQFRELWGYNGDTGEVFISGWTDDAWMDCSSGELQIQFTGPDAK